MDALLIWVPYRTYMPSPQPLLKRLLACGAGEIESLIPGDEDRAAQLRRELAHGRRCTGKYEDGKFLLQAV